MVRLRSPKVEKKKVPAIVETFWLAIAKTALFVIFSIFFLAGAREARAATFYFSPPSGSFVAGQAFTVGLYVSSPDQAENATQGALVFPQDKLRATSASKSDSINTLWIQEPSYSNAEGTVSFAGVATNPGFIGTKGKILSVTFIGLSPGKATLTVANGSILANDGIGTQLLESVSDAVFTILPKPAAPAPEKITPSAPKPPVPVAGTTSANFPLESPKFTFYPRDLKVGDAIQFQGTASPYSGVSIFIKSSSGELLTFSVATDPFGNFVITWPNQLKEGHYLFFARSVDSNGKESDNSPPLAFGINAERSSMVSLPAGYSWWTIIPFVVFELVILFFAIYGLYSLKRVRARKISPLVKKLGASASSRQEAVSPPDSEESSTT